MVNPSQVNTDSITSEQIGRAHKAYDEQNKEWFYQVESSNFINNDTEYEVRYSRERGFQCSCPSGQNGFVRTKHGYCSHVAIAMATAKEEAAAVAEIARVQAEQARYRAQFGRLNINGREATAAEYKRVFVDAKPAPTKVRGRLYTNKGFSLLR